MATLGGLKDSTSSAQNSAEIDTLARFAVEEHNKKENALLELARVVKAQEQVVAGTLHHLTLEVIDAGEKKLYEAKIWVKPWLNFKELQEFKHAGDSPQSPRLIWVLRKVIEESAKFDMLLKVKRGDKEEKFKVEVHKNDEGDFHLNQMISDNA